MNNMLGTKNPAVSAALATIVLFVVGCMQSPLRDGATGTIQSEATRDVSKACSAAAVVPPAVDGNGLCADEIPIAYTPVNADGSCGWTEWPAPVLAECTEPLVEGAPDLRGLWQVVEGDLLGHIERIEQCGSRVVIVGGGVIHDFMRADGTLEYGLDDVNVQTCLPIEVAADYVNGTRLELRAFDLPQALAVRELVGDTIVLEYHGSVNRMERICDATE
jgi:hypothetical protein